MCMRNLLATALQIISSCQFEGSCACEESHQGSVRQGRAAATKLLQAWDFKEIIEWAEKKFRMALIPTVVQHFNVQAEQMIGVLKKQMQRSL